MGKEQSQLGKFGLEGTLEASGLNHVFRPALTAESDQHCLLLSHLNKPETLNAFLYPRCTTSRIISV